MNNEFELNKNLNYLALEIEFFFKCTYYVM